MPGRFHRHVVTRFDGAWNATEQSEFIAHRREAEIDAELRALKKRVAAKK